MTCGEVFYCILISSSTQKCCRPL